MTTLLSEHDFDGFIRKRRIAGQSRLVRTLRGVIEREAPGTRRLVDSIPDLQLCRPELFVHARDGAQAPGTLAEVLWGLLPRNNRPDRLPLTTDHLGVATIPGVGSLHTNRARARLTFRLDVSDHDDIRLEAVVGEGGRVDGAFVPTRRVPGHPFELTSPPHPTIECLLPSDDGVSARPVEPSQHLDALSVACDAIARVDPAYYAELVACLRMICLFLHPTANSYADMAGHGCVFINVRWPATVPFFIEELCHQGGHVVLRAACLLRHEYMVDPTLDVRELGAPPHDDRSLYSVFHGVYTEHMIARVLARTDAGVELAPEHQEEVFGRLVQIHDKHRRDLCLLDREHPRGLTALGRALLEHYQRTWDELTSARPELLVARPYYGSYEFDFAGYRGINPPRDQVIAAATSRSEPNVPSRLG